MIKRTEETDKKEIKRLDEANEIRLVESRKRIAHAIQILKHWTWSTTDFDLDKFSTDVAHATNLLERVSEEMQWHCDWFDYDDSICLEIDNACLDFGLLMSSIIYEKEIDNELLVSDLKEGLIKLSKTLATLIRWDDESQDINEV